MTPNEQLPMRGGLCIQGAGFEQAANVLYENVLLPLGFEVVRFSRAPYLSRGDIFQSFYTLSDAIFVLRLATGCSSTTL